MASTTFTLRVETEMKKRPKNWQRAPAEAGHFSQPRRFASTST